VDVIFDPADTNQLTIEYEGYPPWTAKWLIIGERTGPRPKLPSKLQPQPAGNSRLLAAAAKQNEQRKAIQTPAVTYRNVKKACEGND
jgi:putative transposase